MSGGNDAPLFDWEAAARAHADAQADAEMYAAHEEWLQTSWGGWAVRTVRAFADNSFFHAIADSLNNQQDGKDATAILVTNGARLAVILAMILMTVAIGRIVQMIVGQDIVVEQEVIVEEEVRRSELDDEDDANDGESTAVEEEVVYEEATDGAEAAKVLTRRGARERKKDK